MQLCWLPHTGSSCTHALGITMGGGRGDRLYLTLSASPSPLQNTEKEEKERIIAKTWSALRNYFPPPNIHWNLQ